jgi:hypothetical protein
MNADMRRSAQAPPPFCGGALQTKIVKDCKKRSHTDDDDNRNEKDFFVS